MSDTSLEQTESTNLVHTEAADAEHGDLRLEVKEPDAGAIPISKATLEANIPAPTHIKNRSATIEHLAARRSITPLAADAPEVKQRLTELRPELTTLAANYRWGEASITTTAERLIPVLNLGPIQQWAPVLIPYLLEIDRAGNLVPVWLNIIEREDMLDLPPDANPAETPIGRARRYGLLMLGNYKSPEISHALGKLAIQPDTSLHATQSLVKQATTVAMQELMSALKEAEGWAKVDIVEACLALNASRFHDIIVASGLDRVTGLESYIAIPVYRSISLERYLRGGNGITPRLMQQAALIFGQVLQDSIRANPDMLPVVFEQPLASLAMALFTGARSMPCWQNVLAVHRMATLLGRYWGDISRGIIKDPRIIDPISAALPMMNDVERWMNGPGRDVLLEALQSSDEEASNAAVKVLGEMREPRAFAILAHSIESTTSLTSREQALRVGYRCDALGRLGDQRAIQPLLALVEHTINVTLRTARPKRRDNLASGDADIPGSIVYAAVVRALGQLNERSTLDVIARATNDFDPYVRTEALEALKSIDPTGSESRSQAVAREALNDPRDTVVRLACQLVAQYRDTSAVAPLQHLTQQRPEVAPAAYDALKRLGG